MHTTSLFSREWTGSGVEGQSSFTNNRPGTSHMSASYILARWVCVQADEDVQGIVYQWAVEFGKGKHKQSGDCQPMYGNMKPDTPEVHELLRRSGVTI